MKAKREVAALPWRMYLLVGCVGVIISGMVGYGLLTGIQLDARHIPLHDAAMQLMIDATTSHLLFEEIISGDRHEDIEEVWEQLRRADWYARAMLEGGEIPEGTIVPLDDEQMRRQIEDARRALADYDKVLRQRIIAFESSRPGSAIEQFSDSLFTAFMDEAENVKVQLYRMMVSDLDRFHSIQITLVVVSFLLTLLVGVVLHRHIRRHIHDMQALRLVKDDLEKDITERKRAEEALRESEEQFRVLFENAPLGYQSLNEDGNLIAVNEAWCKTLGYEKDEVVGRNFSEFIHPDFKEVFRENFPRFKKAGYILGIEFEMIKKDGSQILVSFNGRIGRNPDDSFKQTHCILHDITERKRAEKSLRREQERAQEYLNIAGAIIVALDVEGKISLINQKGREVLEAGKDELIGKDWFANFLPENIQAEIKGVFKSLMAGEIEGVEYYENLIVTARGREKIISWHNSFLTDETGKRIGILSSGEDITERKRAAEELQESKEKYKMLYEEAPVAMFRTSIEDGTALAVNEVGVRLFGYESKEEFLAEFKASERYADPDGRVRLLGELNAKGEVRNAETRFTRKDGIPFSVEYSAKMYPEKGYLEGAVVDITKRKKTEEEIGKFKTIADKASYGAAIVSMDGNLLYINECFSEMHGYNPEELIGQHLSIFHAAEQMKTVNLMIKTLTEEGSCSSVEVWHKHRDGSVFPTLMSGTVITDAEDQPLYIAATASDITKFKQAEEKSKMATEHLRLSIENMTEAYALHEAIFDKNDRMVDYRFLEFNTAAQEIAGIPRQKIIGRRALALFPSVVERGLMDRYADVMATGEPAHIEDFYYEGDSLNKAFDISCFRLDAQHFVCIFRDVTERRKSEEALRRAHEELEERVLERTAELSLANKDLKKQIRVRERIEKKLREYQNELQTLASELSLAEERERRRFAANLHDTISQNLVMAHMKLESLTVDILPDEVSASIKQANQMVGEALERTQTLTFELSPPVLHRLGLGPAVESLGDRMHQLHGLKVELVDQGPTKPLTEDLGAFLFRATRELLINVVKHAETEHVKVTVKKIRSTIWVEVEDRGVGFVHADTKVGRRRGEGFGLFSIQEHLTRLGGSLKIWSEPGQGTRIAMSAPLKTAGKTAEEMRV